MSLNVDNLEQDLRVGKKLFTFDLDATEFVLGADLNGRFGAKFKEGTHYYLNRTMSIQEKLDSYAAFTQEVRSDSSCLEFEPESFMRRSSLGHLVQDIHELKPRRRDYFSY